jgi:hypothetical protein
VGEIAAPLAQPGKYITGFFDSSRAKNETSKRGCLYKVGKKGLDKTDLF